MAGPGVQDKTVEFEAEVVELHGTTLVRLPTDASKALPSRGQVAVTATVDGSSYRTVVEPDGRRGHWLRLPADGGGAVGGAVGESVTVSLEVAEAWPEPEVPDDLAATLDAASPEIQEMWDDITPMARWEWVRWVGATNNPDTRSRRVEVTISKMEHGKRRPCCFDRSSCTDPGVSKSGKLILD